MKSAAETEQEARAFAASTAYPKGARALMRRVLALLDAERAAARPWFELQEARAKRDAFAGAVRDGSDYADPHRPCAVCHADAEQPCTDEDPHAELPHRFRGRSFEEITKLIARDIRARRGSVYEDREP